LSRPWLCWKDGIRKDFFNAIGENYEDMNWKEIADNREEWGRICPIARWSYRP